MPQLHFAKKNRAPVQVEMGANLMQALLGAQVPVASSCNGDGVCAKCRIQILSGIKNLSAPGEVETFLKQKYSLRSDTRISCQTEVLGDIEINTPYW